LITYLIWSMLGLRWCPDWVLMGLISRREEGLVTYDREQEY